jgi:hypothetical protein
MQIPMVNDPDDKSGKFWDRKFSHILFRSYWVAVYIYRMNFTKTFKIDWKKWACTSPPYQPGLIFPSWWNVRQKSAIDTLCVLSVVLPGSIGDVQMNGKGGHSHCVLRLWSPHEKFFCQFYRNFLSFSTCHGLYCLVGKINLVGIWKLVTCWIEVFKK